MNFKDVQNRLPAVWLAVCVCCKHSGRYKSKRKLIYYILDIYIVHLWSNQVNRGKKKEGDK